jgi:hypothetical protein
MRQHSPIAAAVVLWSLAGVQAVAGYDVWWHMATGREMVATRSLLPVDPWSHTAAGEPWPVKDVVADLLFHGLYELGGGPALQLVKLVVPLCILLTMTTILRRRGTSPPAIALLVALAFPAAAFRFIVRPVIFSLAMIIVYWWVIELEDRRLRRGARHHPAFLALPLMQLAWIWTHREAMLGAALLGLYLLDVLVGWIAGSRHALRPAAGTARRAAVVVAAVTGGVGVATVMGPAGLDVVSLSAGGETSRVLRSLVPNWGFTDPVVLVRSFPTWIVLALGLVLALLRGGRVRLWQGLAVVGFMAIGVWAIRFLPYFALTAPLVIGTSGPWRLSEHARRAGRTLLAPWPAAALVVATTLLLFTIHVSSGRMYGAGFDERRYPVGAARFLEDHAIHGDLLHPLHWGGYLLYHLVPHSRVFVDGRSDVVYPAEVIALSAAAPRDPSAFAAIQKRWPVDLVVSEYAPGSIAYGWLAHDPRWAVIHWDETAVVWAHLRGPDDPLRAHAFHALDPLRPLASIEDAVAGGRGREVALDVARVVQADPRSLMGRFLRGYLLAVRGGPGDALARELAVMRSIRPSFGGIDVVRMRARAGRLMEVTR